MSACKTGCGKETRPEDWFCEDCRMSWRMSPERERFTVVPDSAREGVALMDFINRVRAERQARRPA